MRDSPALTLAPITCCQPCLFLSHTSCRLPGNITAFCLLTVSSVLAPHGLCLPVAVWHFATSAVHSEFLTLVFTCLLFRCEAFVRHLAHVFPAVSVERTEGTEICPAASCEQMSELIWCMDIAILTLSVGEISNLPASKKKKKVLTCPLVWLINSSAVCSEVMKSEDAIFCVVCLY